MIRFSA